MKIHEDNKRFTNLADAYDYLDNLKKYMSQVFEAGAYYLDLRVDIEAYIVEDYLKR